jgi:hypothetical protein
MRRQHFGAFVSRLDGKFESKLGDLATGWPDTLLPNAGITSKDDYQEKENSPSH